MRNLEFDSRFAFLLIPFLLGAWIIWMGIAGSHTGNSSDLEGALFFMALAGYGVSFIFPPIILGIAAWALRGSRISFPLFLVLMFVALSPVAYFQCANMQSSILLAMLSGDMNFGQFGQAYPRLFAEALAIFYGIAALVTYGLYQLVPRAAPD